ncbi:MAG: hypothetical protein D6714_02420 [Bacteroidetes bacterium]|nr:MAG: hypothetical protein D6714_02420 [Bacteroidota bacterium]
MSRFLVFPERVSGNKNARNAPQSNSPGKHGTSYALPYRKEISPPAFFRTKRREEKNDQRKKCEAHPPTRRPKPFFPKKPNPLSVAGSGFAPARLLFENVGIFVKEGF